MEETYFERIESLQEEGYKVVNKDYEKATLRRHPKGSLKMHAIIFAIAGWWTLTIANDIYLIYRLLFVHDTVTVHRSGSLNEEV